MDIQVGSYWQLEVLTWTTLVVGFEASGLP